MTVVKIESIRSPKYMIIQLEGSMLEHLVNTLERATDQLAKCEQQIKTLYDNQLMSEMEAEAYLRRDSDTLRYYRTLGLSSFKKGASRWYLKSDIDRWLASGKVNRHDV